MEYDHWLDMQDMDELTNEFLRNHSDEWDHFLDRKHQLSCESEADDVYERMRDGI